MPNYEFQAPLTLERLFQILSTHPAFSNPIVSLAVATVTMRPAVHADRTLVFNRAAGVAVTLPGATGSGATYRFVVGTAASGGSYVITAPAGSILKGVALGDDGDGEPANGWSASSSDEVFTMDGSTTGGLVGDEVVVQDIASGVYQVKALLTQGGAEATPFSSAA